MRASAIALAIIFYSSVCLASSSEGTDSPENVTSILPSTTAQVPQGRASPNRKPKALSTKSTSEDQKGVVKPPTTTPTEVEDEQPSSLEGKEEHLVEQGKELSEGSDETLADLAAELRGISGKGAVSGRENPKKRRTRRTKGSRKASVTKKSKRLALSKAPQATKGTALTLINGAKKVLKVTIYTGVILIVVGGLVYTVAPTSSLGEWIGGTAASVMSSASSTELGTWLGSLFSRAQECVPQPCIPQPCIREVINEIHICNANQCMAFSDCASIIRQAISGASNGSAATCSMASECLEAMWRTAEGACSSAPNLASGLLQISHS